MHALIINIPHEVKNQRAVAMRTAQNGPLSSTARHQAMVKTFHVEKPIRNWNVPLPDYKRFGGTQSMVQ